MILIITSIDDGHANAVIAYLNEAKVDFVRINTDNLLDGKCSLTWVEVDGLAIVKYSNGYREFKFSEVESVYFRRPTKPSLSNFQEIANAHVYQDESWSALFSILFTFRNVRWLGHPFIDKMNSSKLKQKIVADRINESVSTILTPETIVSNNTEDLIAFVNRHDYVIVKPIESRGTVESNEWIPFFSERVSSEKFRTQLADHPFAKLNYCFLQEYIEKKREWRITVVGNDVFGCIIESQQNDHSKHDWRKIGYEEIPHLAAEPPMFVRDFCLKFLQDLNLYFGAFDFIETNTGRYYFLECNVNGQWLWIEECTGLKIAKSIANCLQHNES